MFLRIPRKGSDSIAFSDAQSLERRRQPLGSVSDLGVARAARVIAHERYHFAISMNSTTVVEDVVDRQRTILHRALHLNPSL